MVFIELVSVNTHSPKLHSAFQDSLAALAVFSATLQLVCSYFHVGLNAKTKTEDKKPAASPFIDVC